MDTSSPSITCRGSSEVENLFAEGGRKSSLRAHRSSSMRRAGVPALDLPADAASEDQSGSRWAHAPLWYLAAQGYLRLPATGEPVHRVHRLPEPHLWLSMLRHAHASM